MYLQTRIDRLVAKTNDSKQVQRGIEHLFRLGKATVDSFAQEDHRRYEPILAFREVAARAKLDPSLRSILAEP